MCKNTSVFIIAIVAVAMIGVMVPDALGKTYVNDEFNFSFNYIDKNGDFKPKVWEIIDNPQTLFQMQSSDTYSQYDMTLIVLVIDDYDWKNDSKELIIPANIRPLIQFNFMEDTDTLGLESIPSNSFYTYTNSNTPVWLSTYSTLERDALERNIVATPLDETFKNTLVIIQYGHPKSNDIFAFPTSHYWKIFSSLKTELTNNSDSAFTNLDRWENEGWGLEIKVDEKQTMPEQTMPEQTMPEQTMPEQTMPEQTMLEQITPEIIEKSKFKKYSDNRYNFSLEYPSEFDSHFKGVDSTPMIWKNDPHPELPDFKVWKIVKTVPEGIFATTYEFKVYSDNEMSGYSQSELLDLLENSSINLFTDMCSPENCTVVKTDSNISTNNKGAKILDITVQTVTDYEKGVTQYITSSMRITFLNANNDVFMIQHTTSSSDNFTHLFYEPHFTYMIKSLETQYIPKGSLKNTSTIFTAYGETALTPENGGGCLIATATYGSEMAPQVQQLRELRDGQLLQTESGTAFMTTFNDVYYSFSPVIADYERENPLFRETIKLAITPLISSLSILNYVDMNSEESVLGYGISLIILNLGMYLGIPAVVIMKIRKLNL
jgi:hypothetical protein